MATYGELIQLAREFEESNCGTFFVSDYLEDYREELKELSKSPLTEELVIAFVRDMQQSIRERLHGICTDGLYDSTYHDGHTFLGAIRGLASKLEVNLSVETTDCPISLADVLVTRGYARVDGAQN